MILKSGQLDYRAPSAIGLFAVVQDSLENVGADDRFQKRSCKFSRRFSLMSRFSPQSGIIFRTHIEDKFVFAGVRRRAVLVPTA